MTHALPGDRLLARAFVASLALHLLLLALIPPLAASDGSQAVETISFIHMIRVAIEHPAIRHTVSAPAQAPKRAAVPAPKRIAHLSVRHPAARLPAPSRPVAGAPVVAVARSGDAAVSAPSDARPVASAEPASPAPEAAPPVHEAIGGMMPLGADEPDPVLETSVKNALAALGVHVTLLVTVDANGHTKNVTFAPALDAAVEEKIRTLLASASWDPAVCGAGMPCEGTATIRL